MKKTGLISMLLLLACLLPTEVKADVLASWCYTNEDAFGQDSEDVLYAKEGNGEITAFRQDAAGKVGLNGGAGEWITAAAFSTPTTTVVATDPATHQYYVQAKAIGAAGYCNFNISWRQYAANSCTSVAYSLDGGTTWYDGGTVSFTDQRTPISLEIPGRASTGDVLVRFFTSTRPYLGDIIISGESAMQESSIYTNNFQGTLTTPSTEVTIYGEEFTLSWIDCVYKPDYTAKNDNNVTSVGAIEFQKSPETATVQFGEFASVTKVVVKGSTTGSNRGFGFYYSTDGGTTWTLEAEHLITGSGEEVSIDLPEGSQENVTFKLMLPVGNSNYFYLHDIEIFGMVSSLTTTPVITEVSPATGSVIPTEGTITLTFTSDVTRGTGDITLNNIVIPESGIACNGTTVTLSYSGLSTDSEYTLTVPAGAFVNEEGEATLTETTATFETPDTKAPVLVDCTIVNGATYATSTTFCLRFNEQVKAGSQSVMIGDIAVTPAMSASQNYLMYLSVSGLAYNTEYTITIPEGAITDASGNNFPASTYTIVSAGDYAGEVLYSYTPNSTDFPETASGDIDIDVNGYKVAFSNVQTPRDRSSNGWGFKTDCVTLPATTIGGLSFRLQCGGGTEPQTYYIQKQAADGSWTNLESIILGTNDVLSFNSAMALSSDVTSIRIMKASTNFWFYGITVNEFFDNAAAADDGKAPSLTASVPANDATNVATSGNIKLTFSKPVKAAAGTFTLNDKQLTANILSNVVTLPYANLKYETTYTLEVSAGALTDLYDRTNEAFTVTFTTKERPAVSAAVYDFVVAKDGSGDGTTIQSAFDAVPDNNAMTFRIFVKDGVYNEYPSLSATKAHVSLIGQSIDGVIITGNHYSGLSEGGVTYGTSTSQTLEILADDFYCENMTISNTAGMNIGQAVALKVYADKAVFKNVRLTGYQDTHLTSNTGSDRQYYLNCDIRGTVDFIFGNGVCYFENCLLYIEDRAGNVITAASTATTNTYGYVFESCTIDGVSSRNNDFYLGRPWQNAPRVVYLNTQMNLVPTDNGWTTMSTLPSLFAEYNSMDRNGNPVNTDSRRKDFTYTSNGVTVTDPEAGNRQTVLSDEDVAMYTREKVLKGGDDWDATVKIEVPAAPETANYNAETKTLSWTATEATACYIVLIDGIVDGFATTNEYAFDAENRDNINFSIISSSEYGALGEAKSFVWNYSGTKAISAARPLFINTHVEEILNLSETVGAIQVYDLNGRIQAAVKGNVNNINLSGLANGCYIVRAILADGSQEVARILKY